MSVAGVIVCHIFLFLKEFAVAMPPFFIYAKGVYAFII